jgi:anti-sigma regulatory factor (Ser/Thr protein kinase)
VIRLAETDRVAVFVEPRCGRVSSRDTWAQCSPVDDVVEHRLKHDVAAAAQARELAAAAVGGRLSKSRSDDFVLMVSELVANAVRHAPPDADGKIALRFELDDQILRAIVMDGGQRFSFDRATFDGGTTHMGLHFVDQLASQWGLSLDGEKAVWIELDAGNG